MDQQQSSKQQETDELEMLDIDKLDNIVLFKSDEAIYRLKVHKYKEVKHYIKGEVLGRGQFGVVREFINKYTLKRYAGKIIRKYQLRKNCHLRKQINKELAITYHLDHRNVLRVYDLFATSTKIYMFMEFCYGELDELLKVHKYLPKSQAKDYFSQIIEGLHYLHSHGIIHRDIKPENLLITPDHLIKLADFGVCQEVSTFDSDDTVTGCDGTPLYHPPELFDQQCFQYSGSKIDIWAAGCVLFKMFTGYLPYFENLNKHRKDMLNTTCADNSKECKTTNSEVEDILHKNVQYPKVIRKDILLVDLFNGLLEKDFQQRMNISQIKNHPWMQIDFNVLRKEKYVQLPDENRQSVDRYRGLTVLTRIYHKYYPPSNDQKLVNFKEFQESCKLLPLMRPSRYIEDPESRQKLMKKLNKLNTVPKRVTFGELGPHQDLLKLKFI